MLISSVWRAGSGWIFVLGLILGGAAVGEVAALLGALVAQWWLPEDITLPIAAIAIAVAFARDLGWLRFPLPQNARQVPEAVTRTGPRLGALQFGFEMGTGMRTFMTSALPHALLLAVTMLAGPPQALIAGVGFGLGRALVPLAHTVAGERWSATFDHHGTMVRTAMAAAMVLCLTGVA